MPLSDPDYKGFKIDNQTHARKVESREDVDEIVADPRLLGDLLWVLVQKVQQKAEKKAAKKTEKTVELPEVKP